MVGHGRIATFVGLMVSVCGTFAFVPPLQARRSMTTGGGWARALPTATAVPTRVRGVVCLCCTVLCLCHLSCHCCRVSYPILEREALALSTACTGGCFCHVLPTEYSSTNTIFCCCQKTEEESSARSCSSVMFGASVLVEL